MKNDVEHLRDVLRHVKMVESLMQRLAFKLLEDRKSFALLLIERSRLHDLSKFGLFEFDNLRESENNIAFQYALEAHRARNSHHPEYHGPWGINQMTEIDVAEMVCDCTARAQEFGTDVREWFHTEAKARYHISPGVMEQIDGFLDLILHPKFATYERGSRDNKEIC